MNAHLGLLICTLIFNIIGLFYYTKDTRDESFNEQSVKDLKVYFAFKVLFIFWDFDELAVCLLILYIVYNLTDPKNSQDSRNGEKVVAAENSKAMVEAIEARE